MDDHLGQTQWHNQTCEQDRWPKSGTASQKQTIISSTWHSHQDSQSSEPRPVAVEWAKNRPKDLQIAKGTALSETLLRPEEVAAICAQVQQELIDQRLEGDGLRGFKKVVEGMVDRFPPRDPTDALYYFFYLCQALRLDLDRVLLEEDVATSTLRRLSHFCDGRQQSHLDRTILNYELKLAEASQARRRGLMWQAEAQFRALHDLGAHLGHLASYDAAMSTAKFYIATSRIRKAQTQLTEVLTTRDLDIGPRLAATALMVEARRLGGDLAGAQETINHALSTLGETSDPAVAASLQDLHWQALMLEAQRAGALGPLVRAVEPKALDRSFDHCFVVWLAAIRTGNKLFLARLPPEAGFERMLGSPKQRTGLVAMEIIAEFTAAGLGDKPAKTAALEGELDALVRALDLCERLPFGDAAVLARECIARRLAGHHGARGTSIAREIQMDLARRSGREDSAEPLFESLASMEQREGLRLGTDDFGTVKRLGRLIKLVTGTTATVAASRIKQHLAHERDRQAIRDKELEVHARRLKRHIPSLKGAVRKLGQLYGIGNAVVPQVLRQVLEEADAAPSYMTFDLVKAEMERTLGRPLNEVFAEFSVTPVQAASMSQVHRGVLKDGSEVAVKVQYPGLERQMNFNFRAAANLEPLFKPLAPQFNYRVMLDNLKEIMLRELRFDEEARNLVKMGELFSGHAHIRVPRIYQELCTVNVLTMEFAWGTTLAEFAAIATPSQQAHIGKILVEAVYLPLFRHEIINSDPHPGNFLVDGTTLWVFDFGAVLPMNRDVLLNMLRVAEATRREDKPGLLRAMQAAGFLGDLSDKDTDTLATFMQLIIGPLIDTTSVFTSENISKSAGLMQSLLPHLTLPGSTLPFLRMMIGVTNALTYVESGNIRQYAHQRPLEDEYLSRLGLSRSRLLTGDWPTKDREVVKDHPRVSRGG